MADIGKNVLSPGWTVRDRMRGCGIGRGSLSIAGATEKIGDGMFAARLQYRHPPGPAANAVFSYRDQRVIGGADNGILFERRGYQCCSVGQWKILRVRRPGCIRID